MQQAFDGIVKQKEKLLQRYVGQLEAQENWLAVRKQASDLAVQQNQARSELDRMIDDYGSECGRELLRGVGWFSSGQGLSLLALQPRHQWRPRWVSRFERQ